MRSTGGVAGAKALRAPVLLRRRPEYFVFPVGVVKAARRDKGWRQVFFNKIPDIESYRERWDLIVDFLADGRPGQRLQLTREACNGE